MSPRQRKPSKRLKALCFDYLAGKRDLPQFLRSTGHNIRLQDNVHMKVLALNVDF